jgi:hypothetical protein
MSLFTTDTEFRVYMDSRNPTPTQEIRGRHSLRPVFENERVRGDNPLRRPKHRDMGTGRRNGVSYCLAAPRKVDDQSRSLTIASIRYLDQVVKMDGHWYFRQRKLMVDWIDNRPLGRG